MTAFVPLGRTFFAVGLAGLGVLQFIYAEFVAGRAPAWPASLPGGVVWAYLTGAVFVAAGVAIVSGAKARSAALLAGVLIFAWALLRHLPVVVADTSFGGDWTRAGKALFLFGGALAVAGTLPEEKGSGVVSSLLNSKDGLVFFGRLSLGLFMILCGIQHFLFDEFVATLVPTWIPGAMFWTYFAGVALIAGGAGMILPRTARLAAALSGLMVFLWVVMLHIPRATSGLFDTQNEWTSVFEALAVSGLAFLYSGAVSRRVSTPVAQRSYARAGQLE